VGISNPNPQVDLSKLHSWRWPDTPNQAIIGSPTMHMLLSHDEISVSQNRVCSIRLQTSGTRMQEYARFGGISISEACQQKDRRSFFFLNIFDYAEARLVGILHNR
jgi:hypothetical protein